MNSAQERIAYDRASVRSYDMDGRLRVEMTPISKANVCPYNGSEIPDADKLGLDPNRTYMLLRDPEELAKAAPTFNSIPLMIMHKPTSADEHPRMITVGTSGSDAAFEAPYLKNSLAVWDRQGIDLIESGKQKELSCGYRYRADMTPGTFEGVRYDGVMRDIVGNHIALVDEGRAGPDVVVGDSKHEEQGMKRKISLMAGVAKGAIGSYLRPKLAQDQKVNLTTILNGVTAATWKTAKPKLAADIKTAVTGKLAQDADIGDLVQLLDGLDGEAAEMKPDDDVGLDDADGEGGAAKTAEEMIRKMLTGKVPDADIAKVVEMIGGKEAMDDAEHSEMDEEQIWRMLHSAIGKMLSDEGGSGGAAAGGAADNPPPTAGAAEPPAGKGKEEPMVDKKAMDAAIDKARRETEASTITRINAIHEARELVRPHVGELKGAFDSASAVFKYALDSKGVDTKDVDPSAFAAMVKMLPKPGSEHRQADHGGVAMDAAQQEATAKKFGALAEVKVLS